MTSLKRSRTSRAVRWYFLVVLMAFLPVHAGSETDAKAIAPDGIPESGDAARELSALSKLMHWHDIPVPCRDPSCDPNFHRAPSPAPDPLVTASSDINTLDFLLNHVPNTCAAGSVTNLGTWDRFYQDSSSCGSFPRYHWIKGGRPGRPWSTESWILRDGFLRIMIELFLDSSTGAINQYRAFRDYGGGYWPPPKGIRALRHILPAGAASWILPHYLEEYWVGPGGVPVCFNTSQTEVTGSLNNASGTFVGTWPSWLQDKRAASLNPSAWHDVQIVRRTENWGNNTEHYFYGRWFDPVVGGWRGLGLMRWQWFTGGVLVADAQKHYLVDCSGVQVTCTTCPP